MQAQEFSVLGSLRVQVTDVQEKKKENSGFCGEIV